MAEGLPHPVAIITGAGSGIGEATALALAAHGWALAVVGRDDTRLRRTAEACIQRGAPHAQKLSRDLAETGAAEEVILWVESSFGRIDALVNNAGGGERRPIERTTRELFDATFAVNTFAPALLIARAWSIMQTQPRLGSNIPLPAIVNVSSMATISPFPGLFAYAASKAALESFVRSIANEPATRPVRAFAIAPGAVETPLLRTNFDESIVPRARTLPPSAIAEVIVDCILGRRDRDIGTTIVVPSP